MSLSERYKANVCVVMHVLQVKVYGGLIMCPCILAFIYYVPSKCVFTHINAYIKAYTFPGTLF